MKTRRLSWLYRSKLIKPRIPLSISLVFPLLRSLVIAALFSGANAQATVVLQYHHISDKTPASTSITPKVFAEHLAHLKEKQYDVVRLETLTDLLKAGKPLPDKTIAITFDDGYESVYHEAFPLLKKYNFPFTVFLNTKPIEQNLSQFVTWQQVREMAEHGATIANHTYSHPHLLRQRDGESNKQWLERIKQEVLRAETSIERETGQQHKILAYPYGEYNNAVQALLTDLGFVSFGQQSGPVANNSDLQAIPRFPFGGPYGALDEFVTKAGSIPMPIDGVQVIDARGKEVKDSILPAHTDQPKLVMKIADEKLARTINCFASGQGAIQVTVTKGEVFAHAKSPMPVGRSRYNCTAPSGERGRFYWYTHAFIRKLPNGDWYSE